MAQNDGEWTLIELEERYCRMLIRLTSKSAEAVRLFGYWLLQGKTFRVANDRQ